MEVSRVRGPNYCIFHVSDDGLVKIDGSYFESVKSAYWWIDEYGVVDEDYIVVPMYYVGE